MTPPGVSTASHTSLSNFTVFYFPFPFFLMCISPLLIFTEMLDALLRSSWYGSHSYI